MYEVLETHDAEMQFLGSRQMCSTTKWPTYLQPCAVLLMFNHAQAQILLAFRTRLAPVVFTFHILFKCESASELLCDHKVNVLIQLCENGILDQSQSHLSCAFRPSFTLSRHRLRSSMKLLLGLAVLVVTLGVLYSAPEEEPAAISEDTLKRESAQRNLNLYLFCTLEPAEALEMFIKSNYSQRLANICLLMSVQ